MAEKTDRMRKQKQTNRELFMEKLQDADMKKFVELITCHGKCTRCSNNYWDGNYTGCHENKNESSCEEGIAEFMEARPGENLQVKYSKKYSAFCSYTQASLAKHLAVILFQTGVVEKLEPPCEICRKTDCYECSRFWCNILDMSRKYARKLVEPYKENDFSVEALEARDLEKRYYGNDMIFIQEILIPRIQEPELAAQAKLLVELVTEHAANKEGVRYEQ